MGFLCQIFYFLIDFNFCFWYKVMHQMASNSESWVLGLQVPPCPAVNSNFDCYSIALYWPLNTFLTHHPTTVGTFVVFEAGSHYVTQTGVPLTILLPQPLKCWDCRELFTPNKFQRCYHLFIILVVIVVCDSHWMISCVGSFVTFHLFHSLMTQAEAYGVSPHWWRGATLEKGV